MHMLVTTVLRFKFFRALFEKHAIINQMNTEATTRTTGTNAVKTALKIELDGVNTFMSVSFRNQSNDNRTFADDPIRSACINVFVTEAGNSKLKDKAIVISWK